jgi:hypothetical protein
MTVPWNDPRCVLCCTEHTTLTEEHVIPKCVGGVLKSHFLCKECNDRVGATHEAALKEDPAIRLAVGGLREQIPEIYNVVSERQQFVGENEHGRVDLNFSKGRFLARSSRKAERLTVPTEQARDHLRRMLARQRVSQSEIENALGKFDDARSDTRVGIYPGLEITKRSVNRIEPRLDGRRLLVGLTQAGEESLQGCGIVLRKIAYEYVALLLGTDIFDPIWNPVRESIRTNDPSTSFLDVEWHRGLRKPFHGIMIERHPPHLVVQVRLFGELVYRILFRRVTCDGMKGWQYTHNLTTAAETLERV